MTTIAAAGVMRIVTAGCAAVIAAAISSGPAFAAPSDATDAPPAGKVTVDVLTVNGSGCPAGTATTRVVADNTGFHIAYSDFIARDGGTSTPTGFRRNCQVSLQILIPQGFTLAIARADYRGRAYLVSDASALQRTNYYFQGEAANNLADHTFDGPFNSAWHTTDITAAAALVYAPCGETVILNVNTELRVDSPRLASWISMRSSDGDVDTLIQFSWKQC